MHGVRGKGSVSDFVVVRQAFRFDSGGEGVVVDETETCKGVALTGVPRLKANVVGTGGVVRLNLAVFVGADEHSAENVILCGNGGAVGPGQVVGNLDGKGLGAVLVLGFSVLHHNLRIVFVGGFRGQFNGLIAVKQTPDSLVFSGSGPAGEHIRSNVGHGADNQLAAFDRAGSIRFGALFGRNGAGFICGALGAGRTGVIGTGRQRQRSGRRQCQQQSQHFFHLKNPPYIFGGYPQVRYICLRRKFTFLPHYTLTLYTFHAQIASLFLHFFIFVFSAEERRICFAHIFML